MPSTNKIKFLGMEFPINKWAIGVLSVIVIITISFACYFFIKKQINLNKKSSYENYQLQESAKHFTEEAQDKKTIFDDPRGKVMASFYSSDGCLVVARYRPSAQTAYSLQWIYDRKTSGPAPGPGSETKSTASFGLAFGSGGPCDKECKNPHPKMKYEWWWGDMHDDCWIEYWVSWEDGCTAYAWYDKCHGVWGGETYWTCCIH